MDSRGTYWAGCYILGVHRSIELESDIRLVRKWNLQVEADDVISRDHCLVNTEYLAANGFNDNKLIICPRTFPRLELPVPSHLVKQDDGVDQPKKASKHQKSRLETSSAEAARKEHPKGLRTARAVLNRLKHDPNFKIDEYVVGYEDRHTDKIQEKPAASWITETMDDLWIPEHRIVWFKRRPATGGEVLAWDKAERIDRIFADPQREVFVEGMV